MKRATALFLVIFLEVLGHVLMALGVIGLVSGVMFWLAWALTV